MYNSHHHMNIIEDYKYLLKNNKIIIIMCNWSQEHDKTRLLQEAIGMISRT